MKGNGALSTNGTLKTNGALTFADARRQRECIRLEKETLQLKALQGELVPAADVARVAFKTGRNVRDRLLHISSRVAAMFAAEADPGRIHQALEDEIRGALEGFVEGGNERAH